MSQNINSRKLASMEPDTFSNLSEGSLFVDESVRIINLNNLIIKFTKAIIKGLENSKSI